MRCIKKARNLKRELPAFKHRLVEHCRRLCAVVICASMVLGGFPSAFYQALAADDSEEYEYELNRVSIYEALDTAIAEGTTLDNELKFLGEHQAEYDELFTADGTLYELKDLKTDFDSERDKSIGLRVFVRIEGDIALDEAYEVDGSEEVIFLLTNKTDTERYVQIIFDDCATEPISVPAAKDIPVEINNDSVASVSPAAGGGSGASDASIYEDESANEAEEADTDKDSDEEADTEGDAEAQSDSEEVAQDEDKEDAAEPDDDKESSDAEAAEKADSSDASDNGSDAGDDKESSTSDEESDKADSGDSSGDKDSSDDKGTSKDKESSNDKSSSEDKDTTTKGTSGDRKSSRDRESTRDKDSSAERSSSKDKDSSAEDSDKGEKGDKTASVSVNKTALLTASIEIDFGEKDEDDSDDVIEEDSVVEVIESEEDADAGTEEPAEVDAKADTDVEEASPSDASPSDAWYINGTIYDAVRLGKRGAVAYVTTTEEFGLDKISAANTTLTYEGEDYIVTVSYGRDAGLPRGVELTASEYEKDSDTYQARLSEAAELNEWDESVFEERVSYDEETGETLVESITDHIRLFDISLNKDGVEVEPDAEVEVAISYLESEAPADDLETEYTIIHFSDKAVETIETESEYQDEEETQIITFSISGFSDVMVIDSGISTYSASVPASPDFFDFKTPNLDMSQAGNGVIYDQDDIFYIIPDGTNPVSEGNAQLKMDNSNMTIVPYGKDLLTTEVRSEINGLELVLLDLDKAGLTSEATLTWETNDPEPLPYGIYDTSFDDKVSGDGTTITDVGQIKFTNASTVDGKSVDVIVTIDSVRLYNSYANEFILTSGRQVALRDNKLAIANADSSRFWVSMNYTSSKYDSRFTAHDRYSSIFYDYTCLEDVDVTVNVVWSGTNETVDKEFLQVVSDMDVYQNYPNDPESYRVFGYFAETFKTLEGFGGTYYIYASDADNIWADPSKPLGVVWVQANEDTGGTSGSESYTKTGLYADTITGEWKIGYSEGWCGTAIEVYNYTTNDITVKKVDDSDPANALEGVGFILYRQTDIEDDKGEATGLNKCEYYTGTRTESGMTYSTWSENIEDAREITTDADGLAVFEALEPCDHYYLTETKTLDGYAILDHDICFTLETYGVISMSESDPNVVLDEGGSLNITIINAKGERLLPDTGGSGSEPFHTAGMILSSSALWLLYITLRRRRRWLES